MYDLHVHIIDHGYRRISFMEKISDYILKSEMFGFEALGFVDHYHLLGRGKGIKDMVEEAGKKTDVQIFYGVEMIFPFAHPLPKRFDFFFAHIGRGTDLCEAVCSLKRLNRNFIIAHPCAFGSLCSDVEKTIEEIGNSKISLEANMSRHHHAPPRLFSLAQEKGIPLVLGSDAHDPSELFSHVPEGLDYTKFGELGFL